MSHRLVAAACLAAVMSVAAGSPSVIADHRIQNPNLSPKLGRGFSQASYEVLSTCLQFTTTTEPTYNYDYDMLEITHEGTATKSATGSIEGSVSWYWVKAQASASLAKASSEKTSSYSIVTRIATERYYASVDDSTATLSADASALLAKNDVVGFFQSCGTGYIRSIRRTAEITAIFEFTSKSSTSATEAAAAFRVQAGRNHVSGGLSTRATSSKTDTTLKITIKAFGLGLNQAGSDTLVATTPEEYNEAVRFAFKSMQEENTGMIRGIEVVSWANNLQFQNHVQFEDVKRVALASSGSGNGTDALQAANVLEDTVVFANEVKAITMLNAEFVTMLESLYRTQVQNLLKLRMCVGELELLAKVTGNMNKPLVDHTSMEMAAPNSSVTVGDLHSVLTSDFLKATFKAVKAFISGFYGPCLAALTKTSHQGRMTQYWFELTDYCNPECLQPNYDFTVTGKKVTCAPQGAAFGAGNITKALQGVSYGGVLDKYCMPEVWRS